MATQTRPKRPSTRQVAQTSHAARSTAPTEEQIRQRAYEIYIAKGARPGDELAHWLQAEMELKG